MTARSPLAGQCSWILGVALAALGIAEACSSDASSHPPPINSNEDGGSGSGDESGAHAGSNQDNNGNAGVSDDASGAGNGGSGNGNVTDPNAAAGEMETGRAPSVPAACDEKSAWSGAAKVDGVSSDAAEVLLSITPDELDLAFLRSDTLYVAHRTQPGAAFAIGSPIAVPAGWTAAQGASLSPDGLRLVLVSSPEQRKLGELTRGARNAAFSSSVDESAFAGINQDALYTGRIYASPAVSPSDHQLFINSTFPNASSIVVVSIRSNQEPWAAPRQIGASLLDGDYMSRRLPTGVSADERTLFYFNEQSMKEEARWRNGADSVYPLYDMVDLGARRGAQPNTACDHLYSQATDDVVVETD